MMMPTMPPPPAADRRSGCPPRRPRRTRADRPPGWCRPRAFSFSSMLTPITDYHVLVVAVPDRVRTAFRYPMILPGNPGGACRRRPVHLARAALRRLNRPAPTGTSDPPALSRALSQPFQTPESEYLEMITATGLELRAGSRILLSDTTLRVQPGDRIGLVGRNGAGKTTTLKVLAGEGQPYAGADRPARRDRLPAAGPAHRRPGGHRPGPGALRPRPGRADGRDEEAGGEARRRTPTTSWSAATARWRTSSPPWAGTPPRPRPPGSAPTSACPTGSSPRPSAPSPAVSAAASSWPGSCSATPARTAAASCSSTSPPTTSTPTRSPGCAASWPATRAA